MRRSPPWRRVDGPRPASYLGDVGGLDRRAQGGKEHLDGNNETTDGDFSTDVLQADKPVLVDFWAEGGPCKAIGPALEELSDVHGEAISIVKLNIDENPLTPQYIMCAASRPC